MNIWQYKIKKKYHCDEMKNFCQLNFCQWVQNVKSVLKCIKCFLSHKSFELSLNTNCWMWVIMTYYVSSTSFFLVYEYLLMLLSLNKTNPPCLLILILKYHWCILHKLNVHLNYILYTFFYNRNFKVLCK